MREEQELTLVGKSIPRVDGFEKVTGQAIYGMDFKLPGMLCAKVLRSSHAHARIVRIDTSPARRLPGVRAVVTGKDVPLNLYGAVIKDTRFMALDKVRYMGEAVAAVAALDEEVAQEALALIDVEYQPLPAMFDPREAVKPEALLIHERVQDYRCGPDVWPEPDSNICQHLKVRKGNIEHGFAAADFVFEDNYYDHRVQHCPMEPHAVVAKLEPSGRIIVWSNTQAPARERAGLAEAFGLPLSKIRVIGTYVGGGFGNKTFVVVEALACALALKTRGRPVKLILTREEIFCSTVTKHPCYVRVKTGVKKDGSFTAREVTAIYDTGAYSEKGEWVARNAGLAAAGPYKLANIKIDSYCVYTNKVCSGPFRGFGDTQVTWAGEQQVDKIARELGIDPLAIRLLNADEEGSKSATGEVLKSVGLKQTLEQATHNLGWTRNKLEPYQGLGLACVHKNTNPGTSSGALVMVHEDATASVLTSSVDSGQGCKTVIAQIAAEELGLPVEAISISTPDTDVTPYDFGSVSSRTTFYMGNAVLEAAREARDRILELAGDQLEANPADLELAHGRIFVRGNPERGVTLFDLFLPHRHSGMRKGYVLGRGTYTSLNEKPLDRETGQSPKPTAFWMYATHAAEARVDPETGEVTLIKIAAAHDLGKAINPAGCDAQVQGSIAFGVGSTLYEEMVLEAGKVVNPNLMDYMLPTSLDMPQLLPSVVEVGHEDGPYGAKGLADAAICPVPAAIGNAVANAIGVWIHDSPITPEKVLNALRSKKERQPKD